MPTPPRPTLLLDAPSLVYRAFFALPRSITAPDGTPVNAVRGFLDMVSTLLGRRRPVGLVSVFDADWRPAWRVDAYPGYKAKRADDPPELPGQFGVLRSVLVAGGLPAVEAAGFEADDVIGTLATRATDERPVAVVTGDRDLLQLVRDPAVRLLFTVRGVSDLAEFDEKAVRSKYGVPPSRYVDFATLRGDPSDGLPGIAGIGEKTAAQLVREFESLDALVATAHRQTPRISAALRAAGPYLAAMQKIVPVVTDLEVEVPAVRPPDEAALDALAARHGLERPVERLWKALERAQLVG